MSGVEDSMENYQSYLDACCAVMVFESYGIHFFRFVICISISLMIFMLKYAFTHIFFIAHTSLGCRKCLIGMQFNRKPNKLLSRTLYKTRVAANVILKMPRMMHYLRHYQIIEREPAS